MINTNMKFLLSPITISGSTGDVASIIHAWTLWRVLIRWKGATEPRPTAYIGSICSAIAQNQNVPAAFCWIYGENFPAWLSHVKSNLSFLRSPVSVIKVNWAFRCPQPVMLFIFGSFALCVDTKQSMIDQMTLLCFKMLLKHTASVQYSISYMYHERLSLFTLHNRLLTFICMDVWRMPLLRIFRSHFTLNILHCQFCTWVY